MKQFRVEKKTSVRNSILRMTLVGIAIALQLFWLFMIINSFWVDSVALNIALNVVAVLFSLWIYGKDMDSARQIPWMMLIMTFPIVGIVLYSLTGRTSLLSRVRTKFNEIDSYAMDFLSQDEEVYQRLEERSTTVSNHSAMIYATSHYPVYQDTEVTYYEEAIDGFQAQIEDMKKAQHFIFMEYHAIEDAESFARMKKVLIEKAEEGVDVRIFYDDMGSVSFINRDFITRMKNVGIQCQVFNPMRPLMLVFMNNRDHRKITVIDGKIGYTGGYNLANEYFNITHPYGYWKDTGVRLEGSAVDSLTVTFLEMWNSNKEVDMDFSVFLKAQPVPSQGFVQPYADSPLDDEYVGENVYMSMVAAAKKYIYFCTPYLIITDELTRALGLAAKRGVDVRIITPGIPDKRLTYSITRSYYYALVKEGVQIFEYTPGFCHAKMCVCDDRMATVGTINMDYRSLYLNFENGVYLYDCPAVEDVKKDFQSMFRLSANVTEKYNTELSMPVRTWKALLRLVAPLF